MPDDPDHTAGGLIAAYWRQRDSLRRMFAARTGDGAEADDLLQELFIRLSRSDTDGVANPEAYLYRLAMNLLVDNRRQITRQRRREADWTAVQALHQDDAESGESVLDRRQRVQRIAQAIAELPPKTRQAFQLHKLEELTHAEVGRRMGISKSAVEKHIMRAVKRLLAISEGH